jgi:asparagine synthase (glutamine-hydrolysing)
VEFVTGLPTEYKLASCRTKRVLREGMKEYLPELVWARQDKMGFVTAEEEWVTCSEPDRFRELVVESVNGSRGILTPAAITYFDDIIAGRRPYADVRRWISFARWVRVFGVKLGEGTAV